MSAEVLADGWFGAVTASLAGDDGPVGEAVDADVEIVVATDDGKVPTRWSVRGGRLAEVAPAGADGPPAEATIPLTDAQLGAFLSGEVDPAVAFMRGDLKPEGSAAAVLALFSAWARPSTRAALAGTSA